jgi:hypothetical protein
MGILDNAERIDPGVSTSEFSDNNQSLLESLGEICVVNSQSHGFKTFLAEYNWDPAAPAMTK